MSGDRFVSQGVHTSFHPKSQRIAHAMRYKELIVPRVMG